MTQLFSYTILLILIGLSLNGKLSNVLLFNENKYHHDLTIYMHIAIIVACFFFFFFFFLFFL